MNSANNSLLHELQNNEAILLMYLANELPAQDRAEVEHMLDRDDGLRLELAKVQQMYQGYHSAMAKVDSVLPPTSSFAAARNLGDVIRQRNGDPISVDEHEEHPRRIHWAIYPISAAAVVLIGMFLWWKYPLGDDPGKPQVMVTDSRFGDFGRGPDGRRDFGPGGDMADRAILRVFEPMDAGRWGGGGPGGPGGPGGGMYGGVGGMSAAYTLEAQRQIAAIRFLDDSLQ